MQLIGSGTIVVVSWGAGAFSESKSTGGDGSESVPAASGVMFRSGSYSLPKTVSGAGSWSGLVRLGSIVRFSASTGLVCEGVVGGLDSDSTSPAGADSTVFDATVSGCSSSCGVSRASVGLVAESVSGAGRSGDVESSCALVGEVGRDNFERVGVGRLRGGSKAGARTGPFSTGWGECRSTCTALEARAPISKSMSCSPSSGEQRVTSVRCCS